MVATAVFLFFISKVKWNDNPNFEALDRKNIKVDKATHKKKVWKIPHLGVGGPDRVILHTFKPARKKSCKFSTLFAIGGGVRPSVEFSFLKDFLKQNHYYHNLLVFVIGTILAKSQTKMAKLQSWSIKIFIGIWILAVFIISKG